LVRDLEVWNQHVFLPSVNSFESSVAAHVPWLDDIHRRIHLSPGWPFARIDGQRPPARGRTAHVSDLLLLRRLRLEPLDQIFRSLSVSGRMGAVIQAHAPNGEKRLA